MNRIDAFKKMLMIYGKTDSPVSQGFYQEMCFRAADIMEILQAELTTSGATIKHLKCKAEFDMPVAMHGEFYNGSCTESCDMIDGPCACGAWHSAKEWIGKLCTHIKQLQAKLDKLRGTDNEQEDQPETD